jgi:hypothetical protein
MPGTQLGAPAKADAAIITDATTGGAPLHQILGFDSLGFADARVETLKTDSEAARALGKRQAEESVVRFPADIPAFYASRIPIPALGLVTGNAQVIACQPGRFRGRRRAPGRFPPVAGARTRRAQWTGGGYPDHHGLR